MRLGSRSDSVRAGVVGMMLGGVLMAALPALAASVGDALRLGQTNAVDARTTLSGAAVANLRVVNTLAGGTALDLRVAAGSAPFKVNSAGRVANLNSDLLDGRHATYFATRAHSHAGTYLPLLGTAADAENLDGLDSTQFAAAEHTHAALGFYATEVNYPLGTPPDPPVGESREIVVDFAPGAFWADCSAGDAATSGVIYILQENVTAGVVTRVFQEGFPRFGPVGHTPVGWENGLAVRIRSYKVNDGGVITYVREALHAMVVCADTTPGQES